MSAIPVANSKIHQHLVESGFGYQSLLSTSKLSFELAGSISKTVRLQDRGRSWGLHTNHDHRPSLLAPIKVAEDKGITCADDREGSTVGNSTNITWHECPVNKLARQELLRQKGCVIWITGLSGSGKSTLACALSRGLHSRGKLTYILDGDNVRHGLNSDLSFTAKDREENIRRIGEVAKLFADAGIICVACLISPYRKDRAVCRALLPKGGFIEVFMYVPLQICEARDPKGLYKLARTGKIKGFTGIDDPYEPPLDCEIVLQQKGLNCSSPHDLAEQVILYLEERGYLEA